MAEDAVYLSGLMEFDIFFSISQTPDSSGFVPTEREMFSSFMSQAEHADKLGFGIGWIAQAHLSTEVQKKYRSSRPPLPRRLGFVRTSSN